MRKIIWRRHVSDPLGKATARHIRDKTMLKKRAQTTNPKLENYKELPLHTCKLPLSQCNSPWTLHVNHLANKVVASALLWPVRPVNHTGQTGVLDHPAPGTHTSQTGVPYRSGRYHLGNCPSSKIARNHMETFSMHAASQNMLKLIPLVDNAWLKPKMQKCIIELLK
jgi:hypothetical protein